MRDEQAIGLATGDTRSAPAIRPARPTRSFALDLFHRMLQRRGIGRLALELPSGAAAIVGDPIAPAVADLALRSYRAL